MGSARDEGSPIAMGKVSYYQERKNVFGVNHFHFQKKKVCQAVCYICENEFGGLM